MNISVNEGILFLRYQGQLFDWEKVLLKFFSKASLAHKEKYPKLVKKLQENIFFKTETKRKVDVLDYFYFTEWMERKVRLS